MDIVSDNGATWTKVSTITERRIVHELAKAGYFYDTEEEESEDEDDDAPEGLLKLAKSLDRARKVGRVHYRYPVVRLLLPRIEKGCNAQVEALLARIQKLGIEVIRAEDIREAKPISEVLDQMAGDPYAGFSDVLNVDCTILLALVSDLSHGSVAVEDWQHRAVKAQIEREKDDQLLPKVLWPACGSRKLVCSKEAADRCREIVATIGTVRETRRTQLIFGGDELTPEERKRELRELSTYSIPDELQLPIEEIDVSIPDCVLKIGYLAVRVAEKLTVINQSVFLYGWLEGLTTISSNRTVVKDIENLVEQHRQHDEDRGPDVWICPTARSLVGKEKTRRNWQNMS